MQSPNKDANKPLKQSFTQREDMIRKAQHVSPAISTSMGKPVNSC